MTLTGLLHDISRPISRCWDRVRSRACSEQHTNLPRGVRPEVIFPMMTATGQN